MDSRPITTGPAAPSVRGANRSAPRERRREDDERRRRFRQAREEAGDGSLDAGASDAPSAPRPQERRSDPARPRVASSDEPDARGRKLDIRV